MWGLSTFQRKERLLDAVSIFPLLHIYNLALPYQKNGTAIGLAKNNASQLLTQKTDVKSFKTGKMFTVCACESCFWKIFGSLYIHLPLIQTYRRPITSVCLPPAPALPITSYSTHAFSRNSSTCHQKPFHLWTVIFCIDTVIKIWLLSKFKVRLTQTSLNSVPKLSTVTELRKICDISAVLFHLKNGGRAKSVYFLFAGNN
jgi:hypothetical protein